MDKAGAASSYPLEKRELIAETSDLRVQILTVGPGQCVPWHSHSRIADTFICIDGPVLIETRAPDESVELGQGERWSVPPGRPHRVTGVGGGRCRFVIVQGVGEYDYVPLE